ncbi:MAG: BTAD domain-containing putative transcriptional regulator [Ilumatobacter sp.]
MDFEAIRLDELCEHALDVSFELAVQRGADDSVIAELRAALTRTPERERRCEVLALALYRAGRQAEARRDRCQVGENTLESLVGA